MTQHVLDATNHESLIELLPWYVNGTLPEAEHRVVKDHIDAKHAKEESD